MTTDEEFAAALDEGTLNATTPETLAAWEPLIEDGMTVAEVVTITLKVLNEHGYDSVDREGLFLRACARFGWDYGDLYDTWMQTGR